MTSRSWSSEALVLSLYTFGEGHRNALLLLPEGPSCSLLNATVFGGAKSKIRGAVSPYHSGTVWLYSNKVKNTHKITDFAVQNYRMGIRDSLIKIWAAALAAEIAEKLKGNISWQLINAFLDGLELSDDKDCKSAILRFLWRVLLYSGLAPSTYKCNRCGAVPSLNAQHANKYSYYYLPHEQGYMCKECVQPQWQYFELSQEALLYLSAIENMAPKISRNIRLSSESFIELKNFLFYLTNNALDEKLNTLKPANMFF